jgi:hypothetical protein
MARPSPPALRSSETSSVRSCWSEGVSRTTRRPSRTTVQPAAEGVPPGRRGRAPPRDRRSGPEDPVGARTAHRSGCRPPSPGPQVLAPSGSLTRPETRPRDRPDPEGPSRHLTTRGSLRHAPASRAPARQRPCRGPVQHQVPTRSRPRCVRHVPRQHAGTSPDPTRHRPGPDHGSTWNATRSTRKARAFPARALPCRTVSVNRVR